MTEKHKEAEFVGRLRRLLDEGNDRMAPGTISRLNRARHRALEAAGRSKPHRPRWVAVKMTGVLAACSIVLIIGLALQRPAAPPVTAALEDVEILSAAEEFEFYEELDFFTWLTQVRADAG